MLFCPALTNIFIYKDNGLDDAIFATNFSLKGFFRLIFWWAFLIGGRMKGFYYNFVGNFKFNKEVSN